MNFQFQLVMVLIPLEIQGHIVPHWKAHTSCEKQSRWLGWSTTLIPVRGSWKIGILFINEALSKLNCYALYVCYSIIFEPAILHVHFSLVSKHGIIIILSIAYGSIHCGWNGMTYVCSSGFYLPIIHRSKSSLPIKIGLFDRTQYSNISFFLHLKLL